MRLSLNVKPIHYPIHAPRIIGAAKVCEHALKWEATFPLAAEQRRDLPEVDDLVEDQCEGERLAQRAQPARRRDSMSQGIRVERGEERLGSGVHGTRVVPARREIAQGFAGSTPSRAPHPPLSQRVGRPATPLISRSSDV